MKALDLKLARGLWRLRAQVLAIALVIASGTALLVMALTTIEALEDTTDAYYERARFADIFAQAKRAPEGLAREIAAQPGVRLVETSIREGAILDMPDLAEPVTAQLVSLPAYGPQRLNVLTLRTGRLPARHRPDEVVVNEAFAEAHDLVPGDSFGAVLSGQQRTLRLVGIAGSPEFVYVIAPGALMPDDARYAILWMHREALEAAYDMDGAFNSIALTLERTAQTEEAILRLDSLLAPYGGTGAIARPDQLSNWFLQNEIRQQKNMSRIMPSIFLAVAAFLTHMVMARLIATERHEIGLLKAFGYSDGAIGAHYAKLVLVIATLGVGLGAVIGGVLGHWNTQLYAALFRFPFLLYQPGPLSFVIAGGVSLAAALAGSLFAVRQAIALPPAEAMQPPSPPIYAQSRMSRSGLARFLDEPTRMILRRLLRWPLRAFMASLGLAMSVAVLVTALQWLDAIDAMADSVFISGQHQDATLSFHQLKPWAVIEAVEDLPGVLAAEPFRGVAARLSHGRNHKRQGLSGVPAGATLSPVIDSAGQRIPLPEDGLLLSRMLAEVLEVSVGDPVRVEVLEGRRPILTLPVVRLFETHLGTPAYLDLQALNRHLGDGRVAGGVHITVDPAGRAELLARLKELPEVSSIQFRQAAIDTFYETLGSFLYIFVGFFIAFATTLSAGVTYNAIRIALSERARELATLRVLGFSRWEISYLLLGEIGLLTWLAMPLGCVIGYGLAWYLTSAFETELFRVPLIVMDATYAKACLITLAAAIICAAIVRRRLDHLDLIAVLKTRE
ncbi:FtsX-like permease family protein [Halomonas sp. YLGW01]|uniref:ABC transporter permease n=1 Tax=Halomonas sp. YLGW01 TaxID=2773308 RepID=UPI00178197EC|nr:FtsX-like permease family protein [Halomonas sp. YLGW01]